MTTDFTKDSTDNFTTWLLGKENGIAGDIVKNYRQFAFNERIARVFFHFELTSSLWKNKAPLEIAIRQLESSFKVNLLNAIGYREPQYKLAAVKLS